MLMRRVIPCLDVHAGRVVKGVQFQSLRDAGDPVELSGAHSQGACTLGHRPPATAGPFEVEEHHGIFGKRGCEVIGEGVADLVEEALGMNGHSLSTGCLITRVNRRNDRTDLARAPRFGPRHGTPG